MESHAIRKIAAILAADVAGYSRLVGADEEGTIARLEGASRELIDPAIARESRPHRQDDGRRHADRIRERGRCRALRRRGASAACVARNEGRHAERRIEFRVGINLGDVVVDGDDLLGDGVNVAARLEGIAEPGGICISRSAMEQVQDRLDFGFEDMGEQSLKNIARPVRAYRVAPPASAPHRARGEGCAAPLDRRAAVCQPVRQFRRGLFRRRHHRGHHDRSVAHSRELRHRPQYRFHLQGQAGQCTRRGTRARRALRARRQRAARRQPRPRQRAAHRRRNRRPSLRRALRLRPRRSHGDAGRDYRAHRRRGRIATHRRRKPPLVERAAGQSRRRRSHDARLGRAASSALARDASAEARGLFEQALALEPPRPMP